MKKIALVMTLLAMIGTLVAAPKIKIDKVDPPYWFAGMKNPSLQIMLYGEGIGDATVTTDAAGVKVDSVVCLDSKNYLFVYLNVADAQPGTIELTLQQKGKKKYVLPYELRQRERAAADRKGFDAGDVLYMLMPDRFANGDPSNDTTTSRV